MAGEGDKRPGQLVHALNALAAGERPEPAEITALGQDHRGRLHEPIQRRDPRMLTMTDAGKIDTRLQLESATPHA